MGIIIGIDVGISTTKIVGLKDGKPTAPIRITAADPITSLYGAFGKYLHDNDLQLEEVDHVMLTGVGAAYVKGDVYGVKTSRCDEFIADALGARYESHLDHAIVISMGTCTSFVMCHGDKIEHIGGIGIGGGTLQGLSRIMLNTSDIKQVSELAKQGNIRNINLLIGDISAQPLPGLPMEATASLFAHAKNDASREDIACATEHWLGSRTGRSGYRLSRHGAHRQPVAIAPEPGDIPCPGEALQCALPYSQVFTVLHRHRCCVSIQTINIIN